MKNNSKCAEVRARGFWINKPFKPLQCSNCGVVGKANIKTLRIDFLYCPYCGAKMDAEGGDYVADSIMQRGRYCYQCGRENIALERHH